MAELFPEDCDCQDADLDILTGCETCYVCGTRRYLTGDELRLREKQEAEWAAAYDQMLVEEFERQEHDKIRDIEGRERQDIQIPL